MIKSEKPSKRAKWNKEMDTVLLRCLTKLKDLGKMEANGFKEADWRTVQSNWNGKFMANNIQLDKRQLQTRFQNLKKDYKLWLKMKDKSGWGWDDENQIPIVDDEQWEQWISAHSSMAPYRTQSFPYVQQLDYLIGKSTATGVFCSATQESIRKRNVPSEEVEEEKENARRTPETETIEVEAPAKRRKIAVTEEDSMRLLTSSPDVPPRRDSSISETPAAPPLNPTEDKLPSAKKPANDQQNSSKKSTGGHALGRGLSDIADSLREKHNSVKKTIVQQAIEILMQVKTEINLGSRDVLTISKQLKDEDEAAMFIGFDDSTRKYWLRDELGLPTDDDDKGQPDSDSTSGN